MALLTAAHVFGKTVPEFSRVVAVLASALFAGAALYINLVEHPARLLCGTEVAVTEFAPSYRRATVMQVSLAVVATAAGVTRGLLGGGAMWFCGAFAIFAVMPFTLLVILPINNKLLDPAREKASAETRTLLERWGQLHAVRTILSLTASMLFILA
jgi:uncharacterized membrane protein